MHLGSLLRKFRQLTEIFLRHSEHIAKRHCLPSIAKAESSFAYSFVNHSIAEMTGIVKCVIQYVRVNNFREKSSAGIDGLKLGAGFEQDC